MYSLCSVWSLNTWPKKVKAPLCSLALQLHKGHQKQEYSSRNILNVRKFMFSWIKSRLMIVPKLSNDVENDFKEKAERKKKLMIIKLSVATIAIPALLFLSLIIAICYMVKSELNSGNYHFSLDSFMFKFLQKYWTHTLVCSKYICNKKRMLSLD